MQHTWDAKTHVCTFRLIADNKETANGVLDALVRQLHDNMNLRTDRLTPKLKFDIYLNQLTKSPSLAKLKVLARNLRELRPKLIVNLAQTTIHVQSRFQQALMNLVFQLQPPATPIRVQFHKNLGEDQNTLDESSLAAHVPLQAETRATAGGRQ